VTGTMHTLGRKKVSYPVWTSLVLLGTILTYLKGTVHPFANLHQEKKG
jgi:hypothetical protein